MEQMELPGLESKSNRIDVRLLVQVFFPDFDVELTLQEARSLHEQLDSYKHLWGNYSGR